MRKTLDHKQRKKEKDIKESQNEKDLEKRVKCEKEAANCTCVCVSSQKQAIDRCFIEQNECSAITTIRVYIRNGLFVTKNYMFFENRTSMFLCNDDNDSNKGNNNTPRRTNLLSTFSYYITENTHTQYYMEMYVMYASFCIWLKLSLVLKSSMRERKIEKEC